MAKPKFAFTKTRLETGQGPSWMTEAHEFEFDGVKHLLFTGRKPGEYVLVTGQTHAHSHAVAADNKAEHGPEAPKAEPKPAPKFVEPQPPAPVLKIDSTAKGKK